MEILGVGVVLATFLLAVTVVSTTALMERRMKILRYRINNRIEHIKDELEEEELFLDDFEALSSLKVDTEYEMYVYKAKR